MNKLAKGLFVIIILVVIGVIIYVFYHDDNRTKIAYGTIASTSKTIAINPYAGWKTYSNSQLSLQYPSDWSATNSANPKIVAYATSPEFAASSAGVLGSNANGLMISLQVQVGTYSSGNFCSGMACQVTAVVPLSNTQLNDDALAIINETFQARKITVYAVVSSSTRVGGTSVDLANVGNGLSISGQLEYSSPSMSSSTVSAPVSDVSSFQSSSDFTNLVLLINSVKFNQV